FVTPLTTTVRVTRCPSITWAAVQTKVRSPRVNRTPDPCARPARIVTLASCSWGTTFSAAGAGLATVRQSNANPRTNDFIFFPRWAGGGVLIAAPGRQKKRQTTEKET